MLTNPDTASGRKLLNSTENDIEDIARLLDKDRIRSGADKPPTHHERDRTMRRPLPKKGPE